MFTKNKLSLLMSGIIAVGVSFELMAAPPVAPPGQTVAAEQKASKASASVLAKAARDELQDVIVVFEDGDVVAQAAAHSRALGLTSDTDLDALAAVLEGTARGLAVVKAEAHATLESEDVEVLRDYSNVPYQFLRVHGRGAMERLLASPRVKQVSDVENYQLDLAQSIPLVRQPGAASLGHIGAGTTIGVIDTGVDYRRPEFGSCIVPGYPSSCRVKVSEDLALNDSLLDDNGHGTNVSAIAAAMAPGANLVVIDVLEPNGLISSDKIIDALDLLINLKLNTKLKISSVNMSLSGEQIYDSRSACEGHILAAAIQRTRDAHIIPVAASGNSGSTTGISAPACITGVVSVGAVYDANIGPVTYPDSGCSDMNTYTDKVACFSNSSSLLRLWAPGAAITAAGMTYYGTSQAAPHVAGAVAVLRGASAYPNDSMQTTISRMTSTGPSITDSRNNVTKPRLDLEAAITQTSTW